MRGKEKYQYSEAVGLQKSLDFGYDTEEEAVLRFYINQRINIVHELEKTQKIIDKLRKDLARLDKKYGSLKELFPEEFI